MEILSALGLAFSVPPLEILTNILLATFIWCVTVVVYRLYFHPLAKIPGPLLAKATHAYSFYYNGVLGGRYYLKIEELHKQYGERVDCSIIYDLSIAATAMSSIRLWAHGLTLCDTSRTRGPYHTGRGSS
jgi:hypothetical protein